VAAWRTDASHVKAVLRLPADDVRAARVVARLERCRVAVVMTRLVDWAASASCHVRRWVQPRPALDMVHRPAGPAGAALPGGAAAGGVPSPACPARASGVDADHDPVTGGALAGPLWCGVAHCCAVASPCPVAVVLRARPWSEREPVQTWAAGNAIAGSAGLGRAGCLQPSCAGAARVALALPEWRCRCPSGAAAARVAGWRPPAADHRAPSS